MPAGVWLIASAPAGLPTLAAAVFALSVLVMFSASAAVHLRRWSPRTTEVLFRLDHTGILLAAAGTATAGGSMPPVSNRVGWTSPPLA